MAVNINGIYTVADKKRIKLDIMVSDAHPGYSGVYLNGKRIARGPAVGGVDLGNGNDLIGKTLSIDTHVRVVNFDSFRTGVIISLKGGDRDEYFSGEMKATNLGDIIEYHASIQFVGEKINAPLVRTSQPAQ